jgi:hypothetical protein
MDMWGKIMSLLHGVRHQVYSMYWGRVLAVRVATKLKCIFVYSAVISPSKRRKMAARSVRDCLRTMVMIVQVDHWVKSAAQLIAVNIVKHHSATSSALQCIIIFNSWNTGGI